MENLIGDLKERLIIRKTIEIDRVNKLDPERFKELILISSGKIFELDHLIGFLDDVLNYNKQSKKIVR